VLANRHIGVSSCNIGCKDIMHTRFSFPRAKEVWENLVLAVSGVLQQDRSGQLLLEHMILNLGDWAPMGGIGIAESIISI
jgi:hypothetical protein